MSGSDGGGGAGRREVAWRVFAAEFDDADLSYSESDEERAPNYVITPTGARVNRLFVVGVLTEIETVSEDYLRARVVDPSGPFVVYAGQYQPDALAFLERADPPMFVAVTGKARTYQPDDSDQVFTSVRPESMAEVDAGTRDRWVVRTAEQTVDRVARAAEAKQTGLSGDALREALEAHGVGEGLAAGVPVALDHYGTTGTYLAAVRDLALDSARVVAGELDEAESLTTDPGAGSDDELASLVEDPIDQSVVAELTAAADEQAGAAAAPDSDGEAVAEATTDAGSAVGTAQASGATATSADADEADAGDKESDAGEAAPEDDVEVNQTTDDPKSTVGTDSPGVDTGQAGASDEVESATESTAEPDDSDEPAGADDIDESADGTDEPSDREGSDELDESGEFGGSDDLSASDELDGTDDLGEPEDLDESDVDEAEDLEDFEPEFDLDDDEREEIEAEFGTEFQSGSEVDEPGSADIETPDAPAETDEATEQAAVEGAGQAAADEAPGADESAGEPDETEAAETEPVEDEPVDAEPVEDEPDGDVDLEDAVMDAMEDLDEGDGAERDAVLAAVVDRTGADPDAVEDAIQDALMGGRCYEPDDATLKPI